MVRPAPPAPVQGAGTGQWLGWRPALCRLPDYLDWLLDQRDHWQQAFPAFAAYGSDPFDYVAKDATLARLARAVQNA